jgi:transposase
MRDALAANPGASAWGARFFVAGDPPELAGWGASRVLQRTALWSSDTRSPKSGEGAVSATAATRAMLTEAFTDERVTAVMAHTLALRAPETNSGDLRAPVIRW